MSATLDGLPIERRCGWCSAALGPTLPVWADRVVSHGMCDPCAARVLSGLSDEMGQGVPPENATDRTVVVAETPLVRAAAYSTSPFPPFNGTVPHGRRSGVSRD